MARMGHQRLRRSPFRDSARSESLSVEIAVVAPGARTYMLRKTRIRKPGSRLYSVAMVITSEPAMIRCQLGRLLDKRQLTPEEIVRSIGLDYASVERLVSGKPDNIDFETIDRLCRRLDCDVGELLQWVDG